MTVPFIKKEKHEIIEYFSHWKGTFTGNVKKYADIKPLKICPTQFIYKIKAELASGWDFFGISNPKFRYQGSGIGIFYFGLD